MSLQVVLQFVVVHVRVLPYLQTTFGSTSVLYRSFLIFGFPVGRHARVTRGTLPARATLPHRSPVLASTSVHHSLRVAD